MGLNLAKYTLDSDVVLVDAYIHVTGLSINYDSGQARIEVQIHKDKAARDAGRACVLTAQASVSLEGQPERKAVPALVEEGTGKVVRNAVPGSPATPPFAEVFGDKRASGNELQLAYGFLKGIPPFNEATDVFEG